MTPLKRERTLFWGTGASALAIILFIVTGASSLAIIKAELAHSSRSRLSPNRYGP